MVIFTTLEVRNGELYARDDDKYVDNLYGTDKGEENTLKNAEGKIRTFAVVMDFIRDEFQEMLREERGKVYWLKANYHNLDFNLDQVVRAFCCLSPPGKTGKEIWVNLTGGSNVMNMAALLATAMSGITGRAYYTYTHNIRFLRPVNESEFWHDVPVFKVDFDRDYEAILRALKGRDWVDSSELLERVKTSRWQFRADKNSFAPDYLNKLDGWLIEREGESNRLSLAGRHFLDLMENKWMRALIYKEELQSPLSPSDVFEEVPL
jgi:hypothetical protein